MGMRVAVQEGKGRKFGDGFLGIYPAGDPVPVPGVKGQAVAIEELAESLDGPQPALEEIAILDLQAAGQPGDG
jgi:hypothetical protein